MSQTTSPRGPAPGARRSSCRGAGLLAAVAAALLMAPSVSAAPSIQEGFQAASEEFNVPGELLMGVSYTVTAWHNARGFDAHSAREFGVMGLRQQEEGPSLQEASALLQLPSDVVREDLLQNIRGGAALLASYAREANAGRAAPGELSLESATAWWAAAARYSGVNDARHQDMFAVQVFETLDQGAEGRAESGEIIRLPPTPLPSLIGAWIEDARGQHERQVDAISPEVDYAGAAWVPACSSNYSNYSRTSSDIRYIVIHKIEGSYSGCISWFQNCSAQVSAHYVVSKNGAVTQMVLEEDVAWHAGNWDYNKASVGIEHEGYTANDDVTDAEYRASADVSRDVCNRNGIAKTRTYVIGHNEVPGATHTDPGPHWDWDYYMQLIGGTGGGGGSDPGTQTGNLVGLVKAEDIYSGTPIAGAKVTLNTGSSATTDSSGYYKFSGLAAGTYTVTVTASCYEAATASKTVQAGIDNWASVALFSDGTCGDDGTADGTGDSGCRMMFPGASGRTRIHTASVAPLEALPLGSVGLLVGLAGMGILWRRRRQ